MNTALQVAATKLGKIYKIDPAALMAVVMVESGGKLSDTVNGVEVPLIRWEGHYFYRLLKGADRERAVREGLASPKAQAVKNPRSQQGRYGLLARAEAIDSPAAIQSCSWGCGQVMGQHWKWLGYDSPMDFVREAKNGIEGQMALMMRYIVKAGLLDEIQRGDWSAFARGYNGPNYRKFKYDEQLAKQFAKFSGSPTSSTMLRLGSQGKRVRELQSLLVRAGYSMNVDGDFGPSTKAALVKFQKKSGLDADGVAGPQTMRILTQYLQTEEDDPGYEPIHAVQEVKQGSVSALGGVVAQTQIDDAATKLEPLVGQSNVIDTLFSVLQFASVALIIFGVGYAAYGWWRSNKTYEGTT